MDKFEQQPPAPDTTIENAEKTEAQQERLGESALSKVADTKQIVDSRIEARTKTVQNILSSLEIKGFEGQETHAERETSNPEEILNKVRSKFNRSENPSIDDISRVYLHRNWKLEIFNLGSQEINSKFNRFFHQKIIWHNKILNYRLG